MASLTPFQPQKRPVKQLVAGLLFLLLAALFTDFNGLKSLLSQPIELMGSGAGGRAIESLSTACTSEITESAQLTREQLLQILSVPERDNKSRIREIVAEPYCQLSALNVRAGVQAEREAYPLAFDPNTTLVLLFENEEYAGYRFKM